MRKIPKGEDTISFHYCCFTIELFPPNGTLPTSYIGPFAADVIGEAHAVNQSIPSSLSCFLNESEGQWNTSWSGWVFL